MSSKKLTILPKMLADKLIQLHATIVKFSIFLVIKDETLNEWRTKFLDVVQKVSLGKGLTNNEMDLIWQACNWLRHTDSWEMIKLAKHISSLIKLCTPASVAALRQIRIYANLIGMPQGDYRFGSTLIFSWVIDVINNRDVDRDMMTYLIGLISDACMYCIKSNDDDVQKAGRLMLQNLE